MYSIENREESIGVEKTGKPLPRGLKGEGFEYQEELRDDLRAVKSKLLLFTGKRDISVDLRLA